MIEVKAESYRALKEELEIVEEIDNMSIIEFSELYDSLSEPMQKGFEKWLKKWGLL